MSNISEDSVRRANGRINDKYRDNWKNIFKKKKKKNANRKTKESIC